MKHFYLFIAALFMTATVFAQQNDEEECNLEINPDTRNGGYSRVEAMGGEGFTNPFLKDVTWVATNPAYATHYRNMIWGDIGTGGNDQFAGFNLAANKKIVAGVILGRQAMRLGQMSPLAGLGSGVSSVISSPTTGNAAIGALTVAGAAPAPVMIDNNLELLGAIALNDRMSVGVGLAYASTNNETTPNTGDPTSTGGSQLGLNLGLMMQLDSRMAVDVAGALVMGSASSEDGNADIENSASNMVLALDAKVHYKMADMLTVVPVLGFGMSSGTVDINGTEADMNSYMAFNVGTGINYVNGPFMMAGGVNLAIASETQAEVDNVSPEMSDSWFAFPVWNLGAEFYVTKWLVARAGYQATTASFTQETQATLTDVDEQSMTVYGPVDGVTTGVGLRFGDFQLDAFVNEAVLLQGLNLVGGGTPTFARLSSSYAF
ncbi:MAG: hypothetical protein GF419_02865 [Ignavibacteriales bacterium]|nr:hypothetical protein [Ignavibacteriales bacterium]